MLWVKQLHPDPWEKLAEAIPVNTEVKGKISKLIPKGVLVDIKVGEYEVEGFVPLSHLAIPKLENTEDAFYVGEELPLKVIELDMENRRLVLSVNAFFFSRDSRLQEEYLALHEQYMRDRVARLEKKKAEHKTRERKRSVNTDETIASSEKDEADATSESAEKTIESVVSGKEESVAESESAETTEETKPSTEEEIIPPVEEPEKEEETITSAVTEETISEPEPNPEGIDEEELAIYEEEIEIVSESVNLEEQPQPETSENPEPAVEEETESVITKETETEEKKEQDIETKSE